MYLAPMESDWEDDISHTKYSKLLQIDLQSLLTIKQAAVK